MGVLGQVSQKAPCIGYTAHPQADIEAADWERPSGQPARTSHASGGHVPSACLVKAPRGILITS